MRLVIASGLLVLWACGGGQARPAGSFSSAGSQLLAVVNHQKGDKSLYLSPDGAKKHKETRPGMPARLKLLPLDQDARTQHDYGSGSSQSANAGRPKSIDVYDLKSKQGPNYKSVTTSPPYTDYPEYPSTPDEIDYFYGTTSDYFYQGSSDYPSYGETTPNPYERYTTEYPEYLTDAPDYYGGSTDIPEYLTNEPDYYGGSTEYPDYQTTPNPDYYNTDSPDYGTTTPPCYYYVNGKPIAPCSYVACLSNPECPDSGSAYESPEYIPERDPVQEVVQERVIREGELAYARQQAQTGKFRAYYLPQPPRKLSIKEAYSKPVPGDKEPYPLYGL